MSIEAKRHQFEKLSKDVSIGTIDRSIWNELANRELNDNKMGVPDTLTMAELNELYRKYNSTPKPIRVNFTAFLTERGGRSEPILNDYKTLIHFDNTQYQSIGTFQLDNDVLYPGDSHSFVIILHNDKIPIKKGMTFGAYEHNVRIGQGLII